MSDFFGLGGLMGQQQPQPGQADPEKEAAWLTYLKNPTIQAGLFNMGIAAMQPKWNPASALPDALSAGMQTIAKDEQMNYERDLTEAQMQQRKDEAAAGRANAMEIAKLNANNRAEIAQLRAAAMLEGINTKAQLRQGATTPGEQKFYADVVKKALDEYKLYNESATLMRKPRLTDEEMQQRAAERAQQALIQYRLQFGAPGGGTPGPAGTVPAILGASPSPNPANARTPVGPAGGTEAPKKPSPKMENQQGAIQPPAAGFERFATGPAAGGVDSEMVMQRLADQGEDVLMQIFRDPEKYNKLRAGVSNPDVLDRYRKGLLLFKQGN